MLHCARSYWIFGLLPSSGILKKQRFGDLTCFCPQVKSWRNIYWCWFQSLYPERVSQTFHLKMEAHPVSETLRWTKSRSTVTANVSCVLAVTSARHVGSVHIHNRCDHGALFLGLRRPKLEADNSSTYSAEVKKGRIYASDPLCVFMKRCLIWHSYKVTFLAWTLGSWFCDRPYAFTLEYLCIYFIPDFYWLRLGSNAEGVLSSGV